MVLIGYWPLNESSGSKAYDHSGNENHGSLNGGVTQGATGILGTTAYSFDGEDDNVDTNRNPVLVGDGGTASHFAWVKQGSSKTRHEVVNHAGRWLNIQDGYISAYIKGVTSSYLESPSTIGVGEWRHIGWTWDNSVLRIYIDGEEVVSQTYSGSFSRSTSGNDLAIGKNPTDNSSYFNGSISNVRIYNHALTPQEVQYLYTASQRGRQVTSRKST